MPGVRIIFITLFISKNLQKGAARENNLQINMGLLVSMHMLQAVGLKYHTLGQSPEKVPFLIFQTVGLIHLLGYNDLFR